MVDRPRQPDRTVSDSRRNRYEDDDFVPRDSSQVVGAADKPAWLRSFNRHTETIQNVSAGVMAGILVIAYAGDVVTTLVVLAAIAGLYMTWGE